MYMVNSKGNKGMINTLFRIMVISGEEGGLRGAESYLHQHRKGSVS